MASYTPNYNLKKPAQDDFFDVDDFNGNSDIIDTALNNKLNTDFSNISGGGGGVVPITAGGTGANTASEALSNLGAFSSSGGTIAGDVKLKTSSSNYGCALTFGDSNYVQIKEPTDNTMEINANKINLAMTSGIQYLTVSSSITSGSTTNQKTVFNSDGTIADACRKIYVQSTTPSNAPDGSLWAW